MLPCAGDFTWFRMEPVVTGRLISGFGRIKQVSSAHACGAHGPNADQSSVRP